MLPQSGTQRGRDCVAAAARQNTPVSSVVLYHLGICYARKAEWGAAEEALTAALTARPDDISVMRELARVARAQGELEKALAHLLRARKLAPDSPALLYD